MEQIKKVKILKAFIDQKLEEAGYQTDENTFRTIEQCITLSEAYGPESEEIRSVEGKVDSDGKVSAQMFSLLNASQISMQDLFDLALKEAAVLAMDGDSKLKIALALLAVARDFYKLLNKNLNESEAKTLLAISDLGKNTYSLEDLNAAYNQRFSEAIPLEKLKGFLDGFEKMSIVEYDKKKDRYANRQRISFKR